MSDDIVLRAYEAYNRVAEQIGLPVARSLTKDRRKKIAGRLSEIMTVAGEDQAPSVTWQLALDNLVKSSFCQGKNDRGWKADLDFICQPTSYWRLIEGRYSDVDKAYAIKTPAAPVRTGPQPWEIQIEEIRRLKRTYVDNFMRSDIGREAKENGWDGPLRDFVEKEANLQAQRVAKFGGHIDIFLPDERVYAWRRGEA